MTRCCALALFLVWGLAPGLRAQAQDFPLVDDSLRIDFLTIADGLPNHLVTAVLQDHLGFLWIGTYNGLARYDGYTFTVYRPVAGDSTSIRGAYTVDLHEDTSGTLWVSTREGGLSRFDRAAERFIPYDLDFRSDATITGTIYEAPSAPGTLWIGTWGEGLVRLDPASGAVTSYRHEARDRRSIRNDSVHAVYEDHAGNFWVGTGRGLDRFDVDTGTFTHVYPDARRLADGPAASEARTPTIQLIYEAPTEPGTLWVGTPGGLHRFDPKTGAFRQALFAPAVEQWIDADETLLEDRAGTLWIGSAEGELLRFDRDTERFTRIGILPGSIRSLYEDRSGILWIATSSRGLGKLNPEARRFSRLQLDPELTREIGTQQPMNKLFEDRAGDFWIGYGMGHLARIDRHTGRVSYYRHDPDDPGSLGNGFVTDIYEDRAGMLWVCTCMDGLNRLDRRTGTFMHYRPDPTDPGSLSGTCANALLEDRAGNLWVGTWGGGLNRLDRDTGRFTRYVHDPDDPHSLGDHRILSFLEDQAGTFWIGTAEGVSAFNPARAGSRLAEGQEQAGSFTNYHLPGMRMVMAIREDQEGRLWVSSLGDGLHLFDPETRTNTAFTTRDGLAHDMVWDVQMDDQGRLWVATENGLSRFDSETLTFRSYDTSDGLPSNQFRERTGLKSKTGELFFSTAGGITVFDPEQILDDPVPPPVALTGFQLLGKDVSIGGTSLLKAHISVAEEITLSHDQRDFTLTYAALSYRYPEKQQYTYRLEGYDDAWRAAGPQRTATYTNLAPGAYTFRVKAANRDGVWNEEGASIRITIAPPWWRTLWAYAFYVVAILAVVLGGYRWRVHRLKRLALELQHMVRERTGELIAEKKKTEEQAQKLLELGRAKDRFFANVSHEFRTPLTLILGPLQDVLDGVHGSADPRVHRQLRVIRRSGRRLYHLISELLNLTRLDVGRLPLQRRRGDLVAFLKGIVLSFASLAERRQVMLQFNAEADELSFYFDAGKLEKVVVNLLSNALKFTPQGGKVRIGVREVMDGSETFAEICVRDTGRGIPSEALPHVFDRFYQVDASTTRAHEGTGIGLALAKSLVALHGGTIDVESQEGFGSTFTVRLPLGSEHLQPSDIVEDERIMMNGEARTASVEWDMADREDDSTQETTPADASDSTFGHRHSTILLVEDNADVRDYLKGHMDECYCIVEAGDGVEGLEKAREVVPDLVIADVMMPEMDGIALCRAIKEDERLNHVPVILLTAKASEEAEVEGLEAGADDYITKPFSAEALLARVENLIEIRRLMQQRFSGEVVVHPSEVVVHPSEVVVHPSEVAVHPSEVAVPSAEAVFLERVRTVVEAHLGDGNFTVEWLAGEVGLSPRQLRRRLRALVKLSPAGFIRMMRLERAAQLLAQQAGTVSEVAYAVGFHDAGYFAGLFHQAFGVLPSAYATNRT